MKIHLHRQTFVAVAVCAGVLVAMFGYAHFFSPKKSIPTFNLYTKEGSEQAGKFWSDEIARVGGKAAYAQLLAAYATSTPGTQHTIAHIFGGSLYKLEGEVGLAACDTSFSFGCFHEFLGRAIEEKGLSGVNDLNEACYQVLGPGRALSCSHGLGHGIQSYLGYELPDLKKALSICKNLPHGDPIGGCPGGLFMEYNMRTMHSLNGMPVREVADGGIMYPCNALDVSDVPLCFYWQPQWWSQLFKGKGESAESTFKKIGDLCKAAPDSARLRCFEGAGTVVGISSDYDVAGSIHLCSFMGESETARGACLTSAASSYFAEKSVTQKAVALCEGLHEPWASKCLAGALGKTIINGMIKEL